MSNTPQNSRRRKFLTATTAVVGGLGVAAVSVPFIKSWKPSERAKSAAAPVEFDTSKLKEGQMARVIWRGQPVWVVHRSQFTLAELNKIENQLSDPNSVEQQQPSYIQNSYRSLKPEIFVAIGLCTHLGCSPTYLPNHFSEQVSGLKSGFYCPCHGSKFDMAGRVFQAVPAPYNLVVPPHKYLDANILLIGEEQGEA